MTDPNKDLHVPLESEKKVIDDLIGPIIYPFDATEQLHLFDNDIDELKQVVAERIKVESQVQVAAYEVFKPISSSESGSWNDPDVKISRKQ